MAVDPFTSIALASSLPASSSAPRPRLRRLAASSEPVVVHVERVRVPFGDIFWPVVCAQLALVVLGGVVLVIVREM